VEKHPLNGKKRDRKPQHYRTSTGELINGLSRRPDGRWRIVGSANKMFSEPDEALAIHKFRMIQSGQTVEQIHPPTHSTFEVVGGRHYTNSYSPGPESWPWLRKLLLTRPRECAEKTGIEELARLADLPKPTPSPTMTEVGELYLSHAQCPTPPRQTN